MTSSGTAIIENKLVQKEGRNRSQYLLPPRRSESWTYICQARRRFDPLVQYALSCKLITHHTYLSSSSLDSHLVTIAIYVSSSARLPVFHLGHPTDNIYQHSFYSITNSNASFCRPWHDRHFSPALTRTPQSQIYSVFRHTGLRAVPQGLTVDTYSL